MESWDKLLDDDLFVHIVESFEEGEFDIMETPHFVRIGQRLVNLGRVTEIYPDRSLDESPCITISFGQGDYTRVHPGHPGYVDLVAWMEKQPAIRDVE